jgi:predicted N-acyltransferase
MLPMELQITPSIDSLEADEWNQVAGTDHPFLRHEFLLALERHGAVGEQYGWLPRYLLAREDGRLVGAVPLYLKDNSYGEFVFDWSWAEAFHRHRLPYYPKGVVSIPYTPATGPRLLVHRDADRARVAPALIDLARALMEQEGLSSLHWLFTDAADTALLRARGFMPRLGCQFHWHNPGYRDFEDFLARLNSRKRKQLRRERRHVQEAGIELQILHGHEMNHEQWSVMHAFYRSTFEKKSGIPTLSQPFFEELGRTMGAQLVLVFAHHRGVAVAGAINFRSHDTLYGRHWGCREDFHSLHFEACYYQGIEYCIAQGLQYFEPGAQGEHKISRGFLPTTTWSTHWIRDEGFRSAIGDFLHREQRGMEDYMRTLAEQSPYRQVDVA